MPSTKNQTNQILWKVIQFADNIATAQTGHLPNTSKTAQIVLYYALTKMQMLS